MTDHTRSRLTALEKMCGFQIPHGVVEFFVGYRHFHEEAFIVCTSDREWDVRTTYRLDDGPGYPQVDRLYRMVGKVLLRHTMPIAADWGGNFYLIDCADPHSAIAYWDHERDMGDDSVQSLGMPLNEFLTKLQREEQT